MAAFSSSSIVSGSSLNVATLITTLDGMAPKVTRTAGTGASTTSTSDVVLATHNVTVSADEGILLIGNGTVSHSVTGGIVAMQLEVPGLSSEELKFYEPSGSTSGLHGTMSVCLATTFSTAGSKTINLLWRIHTTAGTIYAAEYALHSIVFKYR